MRTIALVSTCLLLAACARSEGYFRDNAVMAYRAQQECRRMADTRSTCADDMVAAYPRDPAPLWSD